MPFIRFDANGESTAQNNSLTIANAEVIHLYNATQATVEGTFNIGDSTTLEVLETNNRGPKNAELISGLESAGDDPVFRFGPGGSIFLLASSAGAMNLSTAGAVKTSHGTSVADDQFLYINLTNAVT